MQQLKKNCLEEHSHDYMHYISKKLNTEFDDCYCSASRSSRSMYKKLKTNLQEDLQLEKNKVKNINGLTSTLSRLSNERNVKLIYDKIFINVFLHSENGNHQFNECMRIEGNNQNKSCHATLSSPIFMLMMKSTMLKETKVQ